MKRKIDDIRSNNFKECKRCGRIWPLMSKYWHRYKASVDGYHYWCKMCRKKHRRIKYLEKKDKIKSERYNKSD